MRVMTFEAGVTVINALKQACNFAAQKRQTVLAEINDIMLPVERQDNPYHLLSEYKKDNTFKIALGIDEKDNVVYFDFDSFEE